MADEKSLIYRAGMLGPMSPDDLPFDLSKATLGGNAMDPKRPEAFAQIDSVLPLILPHIEQAYVVKGTLRCDRCRHWDNTSQAAKDAEHIIRIRDVETRMCVRIPMYWNATEWVAGVEEDDDLPGRALKAEHAETNAFLQDGSDYKAFLITRADFFCAHFDLDPKDPLVVPSEDRHD